MISNERIDVARQRALRIYIPQAKSTIPGLPDDFCCEVCDNRGWEAFTPDTCDVPENTLVIMRCDECTLLPDDDVAAVMARYAGLNVNMTHPSGFHVIEEDAHAPLEV